MSRLCFVQKFPDWFEWNRISLTVTADQKLGINPDYVSVSRLGFCERCGVCLGLTDIPCLHNVLLSTNAPSQPTYGHLYGCVPDLMLKLAVLLLLLLLLCMLLLCVRLLLLQLQLNYKYSLCSSHQFSGIKVALFFFFGVLPAQLWTYHPLHMHSILITHIIRSSI